MAFEINGWWPAKQVTHGFDDDIKVDHYPTIMQGNDALENRLFRVAWVHKHPDKILIHFVVLWFGAISEYVAQQGLVLWLVDFGIMINRRLS